jgi:hypothetical protein
LSFVSIPTDHDTPLPTGISEGALQAIRAGQLNVIEWDHRALGGIIQLDRPVMEVGIGYKGLEHFTVLAKIGKEHPSVLERALAPTLAVARPEPETNSVG